jgi:hypothetical protein
MLRLPVSLSLIVVLNDSSGMLQSGVSWSPQVDFGLTPNPLLDASLLALGNRAGSITVMRHVSPLFHYPWPRHGN